jgi:hypothetical protein
MAHAPSPSTVPAGTEQPIYDAVQAVALCIKTRTAGAAR